MSDGRKPKFKEPIQDLDLPQVKVELESEAKAPLTVEQIYLKRQAEVAQQDNEAFSNYLRKRLPAMNRRRRKRQLRLKRRPYQSERRRSSTAGVS